MNGFIYTLLIFFLGFCMVCGTASAQEDWMPDPNLLRAVKKNLQIPNNIPLTPPDMHRLPGLVSITVNQNCYFNFDMI